MKFLNVRLENMFAYEDSVEFDFSETNAKRNVALVWGRNGMGKTSFLRSLKLLFLGVDPKPLRTIGVPPRVLSQRQFIVGDGGSWSGIINRRAVRRAERENRDPTASISATWLLDDGSRMQAERRWTSSQFSYSETLSVYDKSGRITEDAARDRLDELMPADFVDFFFFDGEDIKALAESDERKAINFDRLLRLTFLGDLADELRVLTRERSRGGPVDQLAERLADAESMLARSKRLAATSRDELDNVEEVLASDLAQLRRLQNRRETLGSVATDRDRENIESGLSQLKFELAEQHETIARTLPVAAPLVVNLGMVRTALADVELRVRSMRPAERAFAGRIGPKLTSWIEQAPVDLDKEDVTLLAAYLQRQISLELPGDTVEGLFGEIDELRADRLRSTLLRWSVAGTEVARTHVAALTNARRLDREIREAEDAMMRIEVGSQVNLDRYRQLAAEIAVLEERIADANQRKGQLQGRIDEADRELERLNADILRHKADQAKVLRERSEAQHLARLASALTELRDELRERTREIVQERINVRFRQLVRTHPVIARIELDEDYTLDFVSVEEERLGRSSQSSGIKQLAATSLLWAMKDVAAIDMPVVVDTPLARIDRENQENMLEAYYPNLAGQVIVLPTNAEIDEDKYLLIYPHVGVQLRIRNEEGDHATVSKGSLLDR